MIGLERLQPFELAMVRADLATAICSRNGVDAILLAGTDRAALFDDSNTPFPHLDCARAHIQAIMRA
jgi:aspartate racemase